MCNKKNFRYLLKTIFRGYLKPIKSVGALTSEVQQAGYKCNESAEGTIIISQHQGLRSSNPGILCFKPETW